MIEGFSSDVCSKIGFYVYRLIDPRNGQTFYVGKGTIVFLNMLKMLLRTLKRQISVRLLERFFERV